MVTETLQYFVFFCRLAYSAILAKCLIINVLRFILAIPFFTAFLNITYWARHTWATIAHKIGVSKDVISLALGHEFGCKTTSIYIDYDMEKVDKANRQVLDYLENLK